VSGIIINKLTILKVVSVGGLALTSGFDYCVAVTSVLTVVSTALSPPEQIACRDSERGAP